MAIERFRGEYYFLSNMYPLENWIEADCGILVPTSEHVYQAAKFVDHEAQVLVAEARNEDGRHGIASKDLAHQLIADGVEKRADWQTAKYGVMLIALMKKFDANPDIAQKLIETGDQELVEGNSWRDRTWGVDPVGSRNGKNYLGRLLMLVRDDYKA